MQQRNRFLSPLCMVLSSLFFALMSAVVRGASELPFIQKVFFRNLIMGLMVLPVLVLKSKSRGITVFIGSRGNRKKLLFRSLFGTLGVFCYFYAVERLQLGDSAILSRLSVFFVILFSALFLREKVHRYQVPALILAFSGALLIIKPGFNFQLLPAMSGLFAAICGACAYTLISSLKGREDSLTIIFWFSMVSVCVSIIPLVMFWKTPGGSDLFFLLLTGVFAAGGQYFLTLAYSNGPAGELSIYQYTQVVFSVMAGYILWREIPDLCSVGGAFLIIGAALFLYVKSRDLSRSGSQR